MAVKQEKVRVFLLRQQEFAEELANAAKEGHEAVVEAFESLLLDCKDAVQVLREELVEDPAFRQRQQAKDGPVTAGHFLLTYLTFIKLSRTIERNLNMIEHMKKGLENEGQEKVAAASISILFHCYYLFNTFFKDTAKKPVRPQDLVRLYEAVIQNLTDLPQLAGLEEDLAFRRETEAKVGFYRAWRSEQNLL